MPRKTIRADSVHKRWMKNPRYKAAYNATQQITPNSPSGRTFEEIVQARASRDPDFMRALLEEAAQERLTDPPAR